MFGVDFSELALIFIVALVVLGPTRLPGLVRKVGRWVGKARTMARDFQQQLENEITLEELNRMTEKRSAEADGITPSPPAEFSGNPAEMPTAVPPSPEAAAKDFSASGYPYGAAEPATGASPEPASDSTPGAPQPGDDTYSHAHAHGDAPMAEAPVAEEPASPHDPDYKKDNAAA